MIIIPKKNSKKSFAITSLGQLKYLSALQYMDFIIGNSSSGLLEAPSFKLGTINIGDRQDGRIKAKSIIDCLPNQKSINKAIKIVYSKKFRNSLKKIKNPYSNNNCEYASKKIVEVLKSIQLDNILKKKFFDI